MRELAHRFLIWVPPTLGGLTLGGPLAIANTFPEQKASVWEYYQNLLQLIQNPSALAAAAVAVIAYAWAVNWTGDKAHQARQAKKTMLVPQNRIRVPKIQIVTGASGGERTADQYCAALVVENVGPGSVELLGWCLGHHVSDDYLSQNEALRRLTPVWGMAALEALRNPQPIDLPVGQLFSTPVTDPNISGSEWEEIQEGAKVLTVAGVVAYRDSADPLRTVWLHQHVAARHKDGVGHRIYKSQTERAPSASELLKVSQQVSEDIEARKRAFLPSDTTDTSEAAPTEIASRELRASYEQLLSDLETLFRLVVSHNKPIREGDVRLSANILRKWLCDRQLAKLCHGLGVKPSFSVLDNQYLIDAVNSEKSIDYFLSGGIRFNGKPVMWVYSSSSSGNQGPVLPIDAPQYHSVTLAKFLNQKRVFFDGKWITCQEIITFVANKLGGVHLDFQRDSKQAHMDRAGKFMTYGGDPATAVTGEAGELHLDIEPTSTEILSGFHFEIVAAAASLLQVSFDDLPVMQFTTKVDTWSRIKRWFRRRGVVRLFDRSGH